MNKVMLIGNVGKDPDVKYYDADQAVAQFHLLQQNVAINYKTAHVCPIAPIGIT